MCGREHLENITKIVQEFASKKGLKLRASSTVDPGKIRRSLIKGRKGLNELVIVASLRNPVHVSSQTSTLKDKLGFAKLAKLLANKIDKAHPKLQILLTHD